MAGAMRSIVTVVKIGGNYTVTIPRALARELGIVNRHHMAVSRGAGRAVVFRPIEEEPARAGAD